MIRKVGENGVKRVEGFDSEHSDTLRSLWFCGDVHGSFGHIAQAVLVAPVKPMWLVFLGDQEIEAMTFEEVLAPLNRHFPDVRVAFIHGNHDADDAVLWRNLHASGSAIALHGQVIEIDTGSGPIRVAGLGGNFLGKVWTPPDMPVFESYDALLKKGSSKYREGPRQEPNARYLGAIYPETVKVLSGQRADILVTHEAGHFHPHGWKCITDLALALGVARAFHGHTHDDLTDQYRLRQSEMGFDTVAVNYCSIKNGLGELIVRGPESW